MASLPPEQMFQLMQQMKLCIQNNPQEARTMLLQNPQLAYALLQAQVVMRCAAISTLPVWNFVLITSCIGFLIQTKIKYALCSGS